MEEGREPRWFNFSASHQLSSGRSRKNFPKKQVLMRNLKKDIKVEEKNEVGQMLKNGLRVMEIGTSEINVISWN